MNKSQNIEINNLYTRFDNDTKRFFDDYPFFLSEILLNKLVGHKILEVILSKNNTLENLAKFYECKLSLLKRFQNVPYDLFQFTPSALFSILKYIDIDKIPLYNKERIEFYSFIMVVKYLIGVKCLVFELLLSEKEGNKLIASWINGNSFNMKWSSLKKRIESLLPGCKNFDLVNMTFNPAIISTWTRDLIFYFIFSLCPQWIVFNTIKDLKKVSGETLMYNINYNFRVVGYTLLENLSPENVLKIGYRWYNLSLVKKNSLKKPNLYSKLTWTNLIPNKIINEFNFVQIINGKDLIEEGFEMNHCGFLYHYRCIFDRRVLISVLKDHKRYITIEGAYCKKLNNKYIFKVVQEKFYSNSIVPVSSIESNSIQEFEKKINREVTDVSVEETTEKNLNNLRRALHDYNILSVAKNFFIENAKVVDLDLYMYNLLKTLKIQYKYPYLRDMLNRLNY